MALWQTACQALICIQQVSEARGVETSLLHGGSEFPLETYFRTIGSIMKILIVGHSQPPQLNSQTECVHMMSVERSLRYCKPITINQTGASFGNMSRDADC